ncbi:MAG: MucR family transcriptional regulator [Rhodospirillaceae bacterium]
MVDTNDDEYITEEQLLEMTTQIVSAYVGNNSVSSENLSDVIGSVHNSLKNLSGGTVEAEPEPVKPAVPVRRSITPDYLVCLEDGKRLKMLKRHLRTTYGMSPDDYRAKWGLPSDYPMVSPNYAAQRSEFAKKIGLGKVGQERRKRAAKK